MVMHFPISQNAGFPSYRYLSSICGEKNRWEKKWKKAATGATCNNYPAYKSRIFSGNAADFLYLASLFAARSSLIASTLCYVISFLERRRVQLVVFLSLLAHPLPGYYAFADPTLQIHCRSPPPLA
jgi:hypothetical protein